MTSRGGSNRRNPQPEDRRVAQREEQPFSSKGNPMSDPKRLTADEMIDILEDIARNGQNGAARIAAIRTLRDIGAGEKPVAAGFEALDELAPRRKRAA